jgi:hypothetical protein
VKPKCEITERILTNKTWHFTKIRPGLLASAVLASYVASGCAAIFDALVPAVGRLYSNKYLVVILAIMLVPKMILSQRSRLKMPGSVWFGAFMICVLLHGLYPGGDHWYTIAVVLLKIYVLFLIIINYFENREDFAVFGISFVLISIITLAAYYYSYKQNLYLSLVISRAISENMGFYINANTLSYLGVLVYIVYCNIFKDKSSSWHFSGQVLLFIGAAWIVIINASRGASLILAVAAVLSLPRMRKWKRIAVSIGVVLLFGYIISSHSTYLQSVPQIKIFTERLEGIKYFQYDGRTYLTKYAFSRFLEDPLWGKGYDSVYGSGFWGSTNHLWYLNLVVAYGIPGLLILLVWFTQVMHIKNVLSSRYSIMFLIFIFVFLFFAPPTMFLSVALAFLYHESKPSCPLGHHEA